jgi:hypothetical protein
MTVTTVPITCDIGLADDSEFITARLDFILSGPDYDTASNDAIPAHVVSVDLDANGEGVANLWPVNLGANNTKYTVTVVGSFASNGTIKSTSFGLGHIRPQSGTTPNLADLLAQESGGVVVVGSTVYTTIADAMTAAIASAAAAAASANNAATAALAAGTEIVTSLPDPIPANGEIVILQDATGSQVYEVVGGAWVPKGWLTSPQFETIALMAAAARFTDGDLVTVRSGFNGEPKTFRYDAGSALTADGALVVDATGMSVGRLVATRTEYADFAEFIGDRRTFTTGTTLTIPSIGAVYQATAGTGNLGQTNAGGQEFDIRGLEGTGDVSGPASAVTNRIAVFDGTTGKLIKDGGRAISELATAAALATLSGRNLIINGSGRISQRGYVSGTATAGSNKFTLDRWFVITSGQNLTFTGTEAGRTMTAPDGGVSQVIEGVNIEGGTYVINWSGTATCTVGGVARAKGDSFTLTANTNVTVTFFSGTFSEVQLEDTIVTPFERVDIGFERAKCQEYYWRGLPAVNLNFPSYAIGSVMAFIVSFPVHMRAAPTVSAYVPGSSQSGCTLSAFDSSTNTGARLVFTSNAVTPNANISFVAGNYLEADAELIA